MRTKITIDIVVDSDDFTGRTDVGSLADLLQGIDYGAVKADVSVVTLTLPELTTRDNEK